MRTSHSSTNTTPYRAVTAERTSWTTCSWCTGGATTRTTRGSGTGRQRLEPDDEQSSRPVLLIRPSSSWSRSVAELRMPEDGADPLRPSGQAAHMPVRGSPQLFLAARRLLARERLLQVRIDTLVRI